MPEPVAKCDSVVLANFERYSAMMKAAQDKYERIFKVRRDITIESKRIIFLLHSIDNDIKQAAVIKEAELRIKKLIDNEYSKIKEELIGEDPYYFYKNISPGNQEFLEALTFCQYLKNGIVEGYQCCDPLPFCPTVDFILGLADLTGELMRRCITSLGMGDTSKMVSTRDFLREMYVGMLGLICGGKEFYFKLSTLKQSLMKVERICYNVQILGSEVPKHMLLHVEVPSETLDYD